MTGFGVYPPLMDGHPTDPHLDLTASLGSLLPPPGDVPGSGIQAQSGVFLVNNPGVPTGRQLFAESTDPCNAATGCLALQQSSTGNPSAGQVHIGAQGQLVHRMFAAAQGGQQIVPTSLSVTHPQLRWPISQPVPLGPNPLEGYPPGATIVHAAAPAAYPPAVRQRTGLELPSRLQDAGDDLMLRSGDRGYNRRSLLSCWMSAARLSTLPPSRLKGRQWSSTLSPPLQRW